MKRLLFIAHRVPYPPDKGERVRALHELRALAERFRVTVAALAHTDGDAATARELGRWCQEVLTAKAGGGTALVRGAIALAAGRSVTEGYFRSPALERAIAEEARREPFDLVFGYSSSTLPYVLTVPAKARVMDLVDADSAKWSAYAGAARWPRRWLYRREARGVDALERRAVQRCDAVFVVSEAEKRALGLPGEKVMVIGNGVDTEYFRPMDRPPGPPSLVFTGTMDYRPNVDGVCWFVREVWPELKRRVPDLTFTIVGRDPAAEVRRLAEVPGVAVTGTVPDVRPYLAAATVVVVPLRIARGIQNKVLEAMAMGRAVVASPPALEGLDVAAGREVLRADFPDEWQKCVRRILGDASLQKALEAAARTLAAFDFSWASRMGTLTALCAALAEAAEERRTEPRGKESADAWTIRTNGRGEPLKGMAPRASPWPRQSLGR